MPDAVDYANQNIEDDGYVTVVPTPPAPESPLLASLPMYYSPASLAVTHRDGGVLLVNSTEELELEYGLAPDAARTMARLLLVAADLAERGMETADV